VTGDDWLAQVLERGLEIGDPAAYPELIGGVHALRACGVLDAAVAQDATRRLHERFAEPPSPPSHPPARPDVHPPGTTAPAPREALQAVLAPARPLADVDGLTVVLLYVELWSGEVVLRLAGVPNEQTTELDAAFGRELQDRAAAAHRAEASGAAAPPPPAPHERLLRMGLSLADDLGTAYRALGGSAGGTGTEWRAQHQLAPGVPATARRLVVAVEDDGGRRQALELDLPPRG
jgi:hypothetical protein